MDRLKDIEYTLRYNAAFREAARLLGYALLGGALGLYTKALYRRFAATLSNRESFSSTFPLLTVATVMIIFVVKSSLALSLGLVGALSIVRFRAAIKEPEEIMYLLFCIASGLALGAERYSLAVAGVVVFTVYVLVGHLLRGRRTPTSVLLTISGNSEHVLGDKSDSLTASLTEIVGKLKVERFDIEDDQFQFRAAVEMADAGNIEQTLRRLRELVPDCRVSYVDVDHLM